MITRGEVMEVYVEVTFLTNFLIILSSLEMMGILLCKEMSYLQVLKDSVDNYIAEINEKNQIVENLDKKIIDL